MTLLSFDKFYSIFLGVRLNVEVCEEWEEENPEKDDEEGCWNWVAAGGEQRKTSMNGDYCKLCHLEH